MIRKYQSGFTLIELMIVVAIMMILFASSTTVSSWLNRAYLNKAKSSLIQSFAMSRSLALRNPCGEGAQLVIKNVAGSIQIESLAKASGTCSFLTASPNPQWTFTLPEKTKLELNSVEMIPGNTKTLNISSLGVQSEKINFKIKRGNKDEATFSF